MGRAYKAHGKRTLMLQDHKGTDVAFRNAWIIPDIDYDQSLDSFRSNFGNTPNHFIESEPDVSPLKSYGYTLVYLKYIG